VVYISESISIWRHDFYEQIGLMLLQYFNKKDLRSKKI
jgi:hypothetical protein